MPDPVESCGYLGHAKGWFDDTIRVPVRAWWSDFFPAFEQRYALEQVEHLRCLDSCPERVVVTQIAQRTRRRIRRVNWYYLFEVRFYYVAEVCCLAEGSGWQVVFEDGQPVPIRGEGCGLVRERNGRGHGRADCLARDAACTEKVERNAVDDALAQIGDSLAHLRCLSMCDRPVAVWTLGDPDSHIMRKPGFGHYYPWEATALVPYNLKLFCLSPRWRIMPVPPGE